MIKNDEFLARSQQQSYNTFQLGELGMPASLFGNLPSDAAYQESYLRLMGQRGEYARMQEAKPKQAYIGKVKMKPGVIEDGYKNYRWKTAKDYKWYERIIIWFST